ncbi:MAG: 50S ribosomal protein L29 [Candidatus Saelkia tenebricola]|nr:50S ribosomal protein L29 [Candidatus Saelkia tenebricola]
MKIKDLRNLTDTELNQKMQEIYRKLLQLRSEIKIGKLQKPHEIAVNRSSIARIKTILNERTKEKEAKS